jgi:phosphoribosylanthranilate isomerase
MALRTFVKVSTISNLSDARYCAGMGVDLLGFCTIEEQDDYMDPARFQEIRGWVTGPQIVAEVYGLKDADQLQKILDDYKPDYLEMGINEISVLSAFAIPVILTVSKDSDLNSLPFTPAYLIGNAPMASTIPFLARVNSKEDVHALLNDSAINGIVLKGGAELKPGLKDTEMINEVLELLETED